MLGVKPVGDAVRVQREHCSPPTLGLGAAGLGLALPEACKSWVPGPRSP